MLSAGSMYLRTHDRHGVVWIDLNLGRSRKRSVTGAQLSSVAPCLRREARAPQHGAATMCLLELGN